MVSSSYFYRQTLVKVEIKIRIVGFLRRTEALSYIYCLIPDLGFKK